MYRNTIKNNIYVSNIISYIFEDKENTISLKKKIHFMYYTGRKDYSFRIKEKQKS